MKPGVRVEVDEHGRPRLVIDDEWALVELSGLVELRNRTLARQGRAPLEHASRVVAPAREALSLLRVAQTQPLPTGPGPAGGPWMSVAQVAARLGVTPQGVTKRARHGSIAAKKVAGCWWVDAKEVGDG